MRVFFALWPPREVAEKLRVWATQAHVLTDGRVSAADAIHVTVAFLGEIGPDRLNRVIAAGRSIQVAPHDIRLEEARYWAHNRIWCAGPTRTPAATAFLADTLGRRLFTLGFKLDKRPFKAHATLIRKARNAAGVPPLPLVHWPVNQFVLARSNASKGGAKYEVLERFGGAI
jgi:2'-5' RNA ligase